MDHRLMAVSVDDAGGTMRLGPPRPLFLTSIVLEGGAGVGMRANYDITRDGTRFIVAEPRQDGESSRVVTVIANWPSLLVKK